MSYKLRSLAVSAVAIGVFAVASPVHAQDKASSINAGVSGGTLGVGPEIGWRSNSIGVRGSATFLGISRSVESDGVDYDGDLKLRSFGAAVDYYPGGGGFRLSAGARRSNNRVELAAAPSASTTVEIGDEIYTGAEIGRLDGEIRAKKFAPTLTLGYGSGVGSGVYLGIDAGVMFQGSPKVERLTASGPIASDPDFQAELARERAEVEADVEKFKLYPILQLGLGYRF